MNQKSQALIALPLLLAPASVYAQGASGKRVDGATTLSTPIASSIFGTAADCKVATATCLPTGLADINYTVTGTGKLNLYCAGNLG
jgi:hypothetical protein